MLDNRLDPSMENNKAFLLACENSNLEIVELLSKDPRVDVYTQENAAIIRAASAGQLEIFDFLLRDPRVDPSANHNEAIRAASDNVSPLFQILNHFIFIFTLNYYYHHF